MHAFHYFANLIILASLSGRASANCAIISGDVKPFTPDSALCLPQGADAYTFSMATSLTAFPPFGGVVTGGTWPAGTFTSTTAFYIFDNSCNLKGAYTLNPKCDVYNGGQYLNANFLPYVLTLKQVDMDVGSPYFQFVYANGKYSIHNNHCVCHEMKATFPEASKGCRCAFPINGEPTKRGLPFEA
jgi:hypothetical protein